MNTGLLKRDIENIQNALNKYTEIEAGIIFGSRAKGNYKKDSDIDIAIKGKMITHQLILRIKDELEEKLPLPYFLDVLYYNDINSKELIEHINRVGKIIYQKEAD